MAAIDPCLYEEITIESGDGKTTIDLRLGVVQFLYYEDLFSPTITAKLVIVSASGVVLDSDKSTKLESLYNNLPIRGGERVSIKIASNSEINNGLEFNTPDTYLYVSSVSNVIRDGQKEIFVLNLVSKEAIVNELTHISRKFDKDVPIDDNVKQILKEDLGVSVYRYAGKVDRTSNKLGFLGNLKKPFQLLVWLASKSVSAYGGTLAGYFFYQTKKGFHFRSAENLIIDGVEKPFPKKYTHKQFTDKINERTDFNILQYNIRRNNDLLRKLIIGQYSTFTATFDPYTGGFSRVQDGMINLSEVSVQKKIRNLGDVVTVPKLLNEEDKDIGQYPSRIMTFVRDVGTLDKEASKEDNSNNSQYQKQSIIRYNLLFQQVMYISVPLNTEISVGDVIELEFIGTPEGKDYDRQQSGFYLIKELCHGFEPESSVTSMTVIRDTFGDFAKT